MHAYCAVLQSEHGYDPDSPGYCGNRGSSRPVCRRFHVRELDLFGSAVDGRFDPARSDLDFLVAFDELLGGAYAAAYFGLKAWLNCLGAKWTW